VALQSFAVFDLGSVSIKRSLAETVLWCSVQPLTAVAEESDEMHRRRGMVEEAHRLLRQADKRAKRSWFRRDAYNSKEWKRAMSLLKEAAPDSLAPLEKQLRSSALEPRPALAQADSDAERETIVAEVVRRRSELILAQHLQFSEQVLAETTGRLLSYIPSENVADGSSRYASKGFFDADDAPPWDTWPYYSDRSLISWVPDILVPVAQAGIDGNPVECILWADAASLG